MTYVENLKILIDTFSFFPHPLVWTEVVEEWTEVEALGAWQGAEGDAVQVAPEEEGEVVVEVLASSSYRQKSLMPS